MLAIYGRHGGRVCAGGGRLARLIQRADMFAAAMSPRAGRRPVPPGKAMKSIYFDENHKVDEAGAALIKAVGIYSPGSYVRLQSEEVAIVVRRGANTTTPLVVVILNRKGMPQAELTAQNLAERLTALSRDTLQDVAQKAHAQKKTNATREVVMACEELAA